MRIANNHVINSAVINPCTAIHALKMKQNVGLFLLCSSRAVTC